MLTFSHNKRLVVTECSVMTNYLVKYKLKIYYIKKYKLIILLIIFNILLNKIVLLKYELGLEKYVFLSPM